MRIVCWNCNGLRTLRQYRPWYALKDWKECLDNLEADIICFQEAKVTKKDIIAQQRDMCLPIGYEAYYSLHPTKGYSGVATFVKTDVCHVRKAEQGLTGELVPERAFKDKCIGGYPDEKAIESPLYDVIDAEGRAVIVDCGLFVLFNLYCPNETDEGRRDYKMAYSYTLEERVNNLIRMGREIVIVGDLNIAHQPIDHCKNVRMMTKDEHLDEHPARRWLDNFLAPNGDFYDITRGYHPTRAAMYTCWDTIKDTRPANYGARIDYTLVTKGLLKWISFADIQPNVYGSDHCPIYVDFKEEITDEEGKVLKLSDFIMTESKEKRRVPSLATSCWPEFAGRRLQSFFTAKPIAAVETTPAASPKLDEKVASPEKPVSPVLEKSPALKRKISESDDVSLPPTPLKKVTVPLKKSTTKPANGQTNLSSFFAKPRSSTSQLEKEEALTENVTASQEPTQPAMPPSPLSPSKQGSQGNGPDEEDAFAGASRVESALAWGSIFAPKEPPKCGYHREPARAWTVNKAGPNHGRKFWMCARSVGEDSETATPGEYRCDFWKWDSDIRTKAKKQDREVDGSMKSFHEVAGRAPQLGSGEKREESRRQIKQRPSHKAVVRRPDR